MRTVIEGIFRGAETWGKKSEFVTLGIEQNGKGLPEIVRVNGREMPKYKVGEKVSVPVIVQAVLARSGQAQLTIWVEGVKNV